MRLDFPIYVDIDGTLTDDPEYRRGKPLQRRIDHVRQLIRDGYPVVVWSAGGTDYAREFCRKHSLTPMAALGKPHFAVDDKPTIMGKGIFVRPPEYLDSKR